MDETPEHFLREASDMNTPAMRLIELAEYAPLQSVLAANPATPPQILQRLSESKEEMIRRIITQNPNTPLRTLALLAGEFPHAFLRNPILPMLNMVQPNFVKELPFTAWLYLLRDERISVSWLRQVQNDKNYQNLQNHIWRQVQMHVALAGEAEPGWQRLVNSEVQRFYNQLPASRSLRANEVERLFPLVVLLFPAAGPLLKEQWEILFRRAPLSGALLFSICPTPGEKTLSRLANGNTLSILQLVARHAHTPARTLRSLAKRRNPRVRSAVAQNRRIPAELLPLLASDSEPCVRRNAASNPALSEAEQRLLLRDDDSEVRAAIALRAHLKPELSHELAWDASSNVRAALARNVTAPAMLLTVLACDPESAVRAAAAGNPRLPKELLNALQHDASEEVRANMAGNAQLSPAHCNQLAQDPSLKVRAYLAANPRTPVELLSQLFIPAEQALLRGIAQHPQAAPALLTQLAEQGDLSVQVAVARHKKTSAETLQRLAEQGTEPALLLALIHNPHTPQAILERLLHDRTAKLWLYAARALLLRSKQHRSLLVNLLLETLQELQKEDQAVYYLPNWLRRVLLQYSKTVPADLMQSLADSPYWQERYQLARHPHIAENVLQKLTHDGNRYVRAAARASLAQR